MSYQVHPAGEEAVVLSLSYDNTRDCVAAVHSLFRKIRQAPHPAIRSLRPALDALLIVFDADPSFHAWLDALQEEERKVSPDGVPQKTITIPVCYDFGQDLRKLEAQTGLTVRQMIELHSGVEYEVWMMGFMPGFPYLGELPFALQVERKKTPELAVAAGSVAIADEYVGIYPFQSPGGWHVIGRTPVPLVDYSRQVPWMLDYGMKVRFHPMSLEEYQSVV